MFKTASSFLVCDGPLDSVATTGTNRFPCVDSILVKGRLTSSGAQAGQLTSGPEAPVSKFDFPTDGRPNFIDSDAPKNFRAVLSNCRSVIRGNSPPC
jgi:hypothetical protein